MGKYGIVWLLYKYIGVCMFFLYLNSVFIQSNILAITSTCLSSILYVVLEHNRLPCQ